MIGTQLLNDVLMTVAFVVGLAILLSVLFVATAALWQRHARKAGVSEIERHLAAVAEQQSPAARG